MNISLTVGFAEESLRSEAEALASTLNLPVDNQFMPRLSVTSERLIVQVKGFSPLFADFNSRTLLRRREAGKAQGLIKACRPRPGLRIVDATAGWGRDAALLASFGAEVIMVERQPVMAALLADALKHLDATVGVALNLSLVSADAVSYLQSLAPADYPDVIYIDPMHPARQKSALVKKDMQVLQQLIGADLDALALLQQALRFARQRVIVKWPQQLPPLLPTSHSIQGKTVRFDSYLAEDVQKIPLLTVS